jgi:hypothetical protein
VRTNVGGFAVQDNREYIVIGPIAEYSIILNITECSCSSISTKYSVIETNR